MRHGSLFSGIGGFDLAAEWMGWENVFHCEWNKFGQRVLQHYWPNAITYEDITKTDFTKHRGAIDILTGGFPCQPYSQAGKRLGKEDDRHLWPEMLRAIREIKPRFVVGENVRGLINWNDGMVFDEVQADLEAEGYEVQPVLLPAASVNAPHKRDRIWFVAYTNEHRCPNPPTEENDQRQYGERGEKGSESTTHSPEKTITGDVRPATNSNSDKRCKRRCNTNRSKASKRHTSVFNSRENGNPWQKFPTQPPICARDDGFPERLDRITFPKWRNESIKGAGNAIVPQVALQIFKAIEQC